MPTSPRFARYTTRSVMIGIACFATYLALARIYGWGRAMVCALNLLFASFSLVFLASAWCSWRDGQARNAVASLLLAVIVLLGSLLLASFVFRLG